MSAPPPVLENQFVQNFFAWALVRNPGSSESTYWHDQLRVAYGQGQTSLKLEDSEPINSNHVSEAVGYRSLDRTYWT